MGLITKIRNNKWILIAFVGLGITTFVARLGLTVYQAYKGLSPQVVKVGEENIPQEIYQEYLVNSNHTDVIEQLQKEVAAHEICKNMGIEITLKEVREKLANFDASTTKNVARQINAAKYDNLKRHPEYQKQWEERLEKDTDFLTKAKNIFETEIASKLFPTHPLPLLPALQVTYFKIPRLEIPSQQTSPNPYLNSNIIPSEKCDIIKYQRVSILPPREQDTQRTQTELNNLRKKWSQKTEEQDSTAFAIEHSDYEESTEETWKIEDAPPIITRIKVNQISPIIAIDYQTFAIYKQIKKEKGKITCHVIIKKAKLSPKIARTFKDAILKQVKYLQRTSWQANTKDLETIIITQETANQIEATTEEHKIAHKVYQDEIQPHTTFLVKTTDHYLICHLQATSSKAKKLIQKWQKEAQQQVKTQLTFVRNLYKEEANATEEKIQQILNKQFAGIQKEMTTIASNAKTISNYPVPQSIGYLLANQENTWITCTDANSPYIFVVKIEKTIQNTPTKKPSPKAWEYHYKNLPVRTDHRYKHY